ncbi:hypothetical protein ACFV4P_03480 [Kitasatospora sp. NPDC059795]|uniref:hypothetical protein n=1 Tax=Kitasatospora sp. NPDC059795 TaxID=3346949 RepID=UPI00366132BD
MVGALAAASLCGTRTALWAACALTAVAPVVVLCSRVRGLRRLDELDVPNAPDAPDAPDAPEEQAD